MDILNGLSGVASEYLSQAINGTGTGAASVIKTNNSDKSETFDEIYNAAINLISSTNGYIQQAQQAEIDYAMGKLTSTHELSIIEEKANIALQYTVAIKNGLLSAYKEIMQIQI